MNIALAIIVFFWLVAMGLAFASIRGKKMNMEQWAVGGRGLGAIFVFILLAGETYSIFTLLGTSGFAYSKGAAVYFLIAFTVLGSMSSYWLLPPMWRYAKEHNCLSKSDFFAAKYSSPAFGTFVAIVGSIALVPYITLLFKSMGILVAATSYGSISQDVAIWVGMISLIIYVLVSGIHGSAWTSTIKDVMIFVIILFLGIYIPIHYYGSHQDMFKTLETLKPGFITFPEKGLSLWWFWSTVALSSFAYYLWPHNAPAIFSSNNEKAFRKNAGLFPLYALMVVVVYVIGFTAAIQIPGLVGADGDQALLRLSMNTFNPWVVGIIGATGLLSTLVPGAMMLMTVATMLTTNVYKPLFPAATDKQTTFAAKTIVVVVGVLCTYFALSKNDTLATLYISSFGMISQLAPGLWLSLRKKNPLTVQGVFAGILVGITIMVYTAFTKITIAGLFPGLPQYIKDLNIGMIALLLNVIIAFAVSQFSGSTKAAEEKLGVNKA